MPQDNLNPASRPRGVCLSAFAVHLGGGLVLLKALVQGLGPSLKEALIDERARGEVSLDAGARVRYVPRSMLARWTGLMSLARRTERGDVLFCFNSLPPLRKPPARPKTTQAWEVLWDSRIEVRGFKRGMERRCARLRLFRDGHHREDQTRL